MASHKDKMKQTVAKDLSPPLKEQMSVTPFPRPRFGVGWDADSSRPGGVTKSTRDFSLELN